MIFSGFTNKLKENVGGLLGGGGGQRVCWPPSQIIGGGGWPPCSYAYGSGFVQVNWIFQTVIFHKLRQNAEFCEFYKMCLSADVKLRILPKLVLAKLTDTHAYFGK